jgi:fatty-acyl-CoA synthase
MFVRMLKLPDVDRHRFDLVSHRAAVHAAAPCPPDVKRQMMAWWGPILIEYYAGSERSGFTVCHPDEWLAHPGTVGRAILGTIRVCDEEGGEVPAGQTGTIFFERTSMPFAYHNDPATTRAAQHPAHPNWSTLGDVGHVDNDGWLYLTDRRSFTIIAGGVNIYPREIEDVMILHPAVEDVAVVGVPNADLGEEVKAVVQLRANVAADDATRAELLGWTAQRVARFKAPRSIDFVEVLPRSPVGKLLKRLVRQPYWDPPADPASGLRDAGGR